VVASDTAQTKQAQQDGSHHLASCISVSNMFVVSLRWKHVTASLQARMQQQQQQAAEARLHRDMLAGHESLPQQLPKPAHAQTIQSQLQ
jgi:hypothetical protein